MLENLSAPDGWAHHSAASDPGRHAGLIDAIVPKPEAIGPVARNVIAHYRAQAQDLPAETRGDINLRRLERQLEVDQERHGSQLSAERAVGERLQGCCRDHTLFAVAVMRQHGVPARSRVGFAHYLSEAWNYDHVIPEYWAEGRWRRFDPEIASASESLPDPLDIPTGSVTLFTTAAETLMLMRAGEIDPENYGVAPGLPFRGEGFVTNEVLYELAHRYGDELLLWDGWGALGIPGEPVEPELASLVDEIAAMLVAADAGDADVERRLYERYRADARLNPGASVLQFSPFGEPPVMVEL